MAECTARRLNKILYLLECRDSDGRIKRAVLSRGALEDFARRNGLSVTFVNV